MTMKQGVPTRQLTLCGIMAAVMCVLGPVSIPIGPVPITCGTLAVYLTACLLGGRWGAACVLVYLLVGMAGAPVFSNYMGGAARLLGPTGGYLVGYLPMAFLTGTVFELTARLNGRGKQDAALACALRLAGMAAGAAVLYTLGTAWYCVQAGADVKAAIAACVTPFLPFELLKMAAALVVGLPVRRGLERAGLVGRYGQNGPSSK